MNRETARMAMTAVTRMDLMFMVRTVGECPVDYMPGGEFQAAPG